jgi:hypothetical protein
LFSEFLKTHKCASKKFKNNITGAREPKISTRSVGIFQKHEQAHQLDSQKECIHRSNS